MKKHNLRQRVAISFLTAVMLLCFGGLIGCIKLIGLISDSDQKAKHALTHFWKALNTLETSYEDKK